MTITAKVIDDSTANGIRITTLELKYPRFIHSEFMTHRMFSRSASSSRAIPVSKMIDQVRNDLAIPIHWGKNQAGMKAREEVMFPTIAEDIWKYEAGRAVDVAYQLKDCDLHKQIVNRVLEPFSHIKVIVTATEWDNFFNLRLHKDAQPEMQQLAIRMQEAMNYSYPQELKPGEWHLPYLAPEDCMDTTTDNFLKLSAARCARVSYLNHDNSNPDIEKDIALSDMLLEAGHMSPFEHQATPMRWAHGYAERAFEDAGVTHIDCEAYAWSGNFRGYIQYRQLI